MLYFRLPFEDKIKTVGGNSGEDSVAFVPFKDGEKIVYKGKISEIDKADLQEITSKDLEISLNKFSTQTQDEYLETVAAVIKFINENKLKKLVLSREIVKKLKPQESENLSLTQTFLNLCASYPNAFVYIFKTEKECWIGAFSELLGSYNINNEEFKTMSLAGTLPVSEDWTQKEIKEQRAVTEFIRLNLSKFANGNVENSPTHDHISGQIKHLRTDFKIELKPENLNKLIAELHPTPAVCGFPKDLCLSAIETFENHKREFYSGYIEIKSAEKAEYFVNLRCAKFYKNAVVLYAGGGINAESIPEKEWAETQLKSRAILDNLAIS